MQIKTINRRLHVPSQTRRFTVLQRQEFIGRGAERRIEGLWLTKEIWPNSTVFIIGGGPSVNYASLDLIKGKPVVGVNSALRLGSWVSVNFFGDSRWLTWEYEQVKKYEGILVTTQKTIKNPDSIEVKRLAKSGKQQGITTKRYELCWNNSSGGAAINLAYHLGARRIVLMGYDMKPDHVNIHNFHNAYPVGKPERNPYRHFLRAFDKIKKDADKLGVEILNATRNSALKIFPQVKLEDLV